MAEAGRAHLVLMNGRRPGQQVWLRKDCISSAGKHWRKCKNVIDEYHSSAKNKLCIFVSSYVYTIPAKITLFPMRGELVAKTLRK